MRPLKLPCNRAHHHVFNCPAISSVSVPVLNALVFVYYHLLKKHEIKIQHYFLDTRIVRFYNNAGFLSIIKFCFETETDATLAREIIMDFLEKDTSWSLLVVDDHEYIKLLQESE